MLFTSRLFAFLVLSFLLSGCINLHNEKLFEDSESAKKQASLIKAAPNNLSSVYFFSEKSFIEQTSFIPASASIGFFVNDYLMTQMPRGSFVNMVVEPGNTNVKVANIYGRDRPNRIHIFDSLNIDLKAGQTYFISSRLTVGKGIHLVFLKEEEGVALIQNLPLAKTLHTRIPLSSLQSPKSSSVSSESSANTSASTSAPVVSSTDISDFFAAAGAVALTALFIFCLGMAISAGSPSYVPPSVPLIPDRPSVNIVQPQTMSVRSASGKVLNIDTNRADGTIVNRSTGVRYRVEGDFITGTDGSRFRSAGSTIFSNSGNYYTKSGNLIVSNDGRSCQVIGNLIDCK